LDKTYLHNEALPTNYDETREVRDSYNIIGMRKQELGYMKVLCVLEFHQL